MTDEQIKKLDLFYSNKIFDGCFSSNQECNHLRADDYLIELLKDLGCTETVKAFDRVAKWYA